MKVADFVSANNIQVTGAQGIDLDVAVSSPKFQAWFASIDRENFLVTSIHMESMNMFGKSVGFLKLKCNVTDKLGRPIAGDIIFLRGGSVVVLFVLVCEGKEYAVVCDQPRLPSGKYWFRGLCAGMLDNSNNFAGKAAEEIEEELGEKVTADDLIDLTQLAGNPGGLYPSVGACEETIRIYACVREVSKEKLAEFLGRETGLASENERIKLDVVPLDEVLKLQCMNAVAAYALFSQFRAQVPGAIQKQ